VLEEIRRVPGVASAALTTVNPLGGWTWGARISVEGREAVSPQTDLIVHHRLISPDFFRTMGIPLRQGRPFSDLDNQDNQPVVIVDERMAKHFWPGESPIGQRVKRGRPDSPHPWLTVVGVVGTVRDFGDYQDTWYLPYRQNPMAPSGERLYLMVRTTGDPMGVARPVGRALWSIDDHLAIAEISAMDRYYAASLSSERLSVLIVAVFASCGLLLAGLGQFGVMSYVVAQRTREIGIRRALGARQVDIVRMVLAEGMALAVLGIGLGLSAALVLTRALRGQLFGITPTSNPSYAVMGVLLMGVALLACYLPARRATRVDPMTALRYE
jgi:putative ABC transport system permease protein